MATSASSPSASGGQDPTIRFTTVEKLSQELGKISGDFFIVTRMYIPQIFPHYLLASFPDVSPSDYITIEKTRGPRRRGFRFRRYHSDTRILIVTIPTALHERLHLQLDKEYRDQLVLTGRRTSWIKMGTTTFRRKGHPGGDGGEGDSTSGPDPDRAELEAWPTLVIEAGDSESLAELQNDIRWWFSTSEHDVKFVLLAKFEHSRREIVLQR